MLIKFSYRAWKLIFILLLIALFSIPYMSFRWNPYFPIFPSFEVLFIYYYLYKFDYEIKTWQLLLFGIIADFITIDAIGINAVCFILGNVLLYVINRIFNIHSIALHLFTMSIYVVFTLFYRDALSNLLFEHSTKLIVILMKSCATIFAYPIFFWLSEAAVRIIQDKKKYYEKVGQR